MREIIYPKETAPKSEAKQLIDPIHETCSFVKGPDDNGVLSDFNSANAGATFSSKFKIIYYSYKAGENIHVIKPYPSRYYPIPRGSQNRYLLLKLVDNTYFSNTHTRPFPSCLCENTMFSIISSELIMK